MSWSKSFDLPIALPSGKKLATLRDAGDHIIRLSHTEQNAAEWQAAMHCLIEAADNGGLMMLARIGVMRALNRHVERVFDPSRKDTRWGKRKLAKER